MKKAYLLAATAAAMLTATAAHAQSNISIVVTPWTAPNIYGSSSFDPAAQNQFDALYNGLASAGTPGAPTSYQAITGPVSYGNIIATNFNSWLGNANPGAAYTQELGNRIHYGLTIDGHGTQFSLSQLALTFDGNGASNYFDFTFAPGYDYAPYGTNGGGYVGILYGADGKIGGGDDTFITSGANTQLVDAAIGRGSGMADAVYCGAVPDTSGACGAGNQGYIDNEIALLQADGFTQLTGTYSLLNANGAPITSGSATVVFAAAGVPEPATWAMMIMGFGFVGASLRRRRSAGGAALA